MLKVGVIGVGSMGQNHARVYSEIADLVGVTDVMPEQRKRIAQRFNVNDFESPEMLLEKVDAVSICTPTSEHHRIAKLAIEKGVDLLVEKPFTGRSESARELTDMAGSKGVTLASGFIERFNPIVEVLKRSVQEGKFGNVISIASRRVSSFPARIRDVGVVMDLGIHDVDVLRYINGSEVVSVFALGGKYANANFEDYANLLLEFEDGTVGFIEVNWLTPMKVRKVSLTCSEGFVQVDYTDQSMEISSSRIGDVDTSNMFSLPLELDVRKVSVKKEEPLKRELSAFLAAAGYGKEAPVSGSDALHNLQVCEASLRSLKEGCKVKL